ncbi:DUF4145 domain-containing protein [Streptomyces olivaceus]|uniref:DUF4145 domain-containing protein n=1 Tax=Streptomyces olivaceus TaxID=47716 RepID=UPI001CCB8502|nr:DUF4145 domain-containing protein [Streptomyces olivaceus]MBZ6295472.1 DUF4145 domain-containing protein [Streptomyces olivaceus]MBZ6330506.1 DUF4145 domain-containing protein [Streptomyces olivaceus]
MNAPNEHNDFQFTPAAEAALRDALKEISAEISFRAAANAHKGTQETALIGVLDVAEALSETRGSQNGLFRRIRSLFLATGLYGAIGASLLFYSMASEDSYDLLQITSALMTGAGIPAFAYFLLSYLDSSFDGQTYSRKEVTARESDLISIFRAWLEIESAIRSRYSNLHGESRASAPIAEMIRALLKDQVITSETANRIQRVRNVRNALAHERDAKLTNKEAKSLLKEARNALSALEA